MEGIPKKIHFTCKCKTDITNPIWIECLNKYYKMYSDYEIIIHDNEDIYNIVEKHFPQYLEKIKKIKIGAVLADIFRYLILYLEGGIYSDLDCEPIKHIDELFCKEYQYFHGDENRDNNFFIYNNNNIVDNNKNNNKLIFSNNVFNNKNEKKEKKTIINNKWDFYHNVCSNHKIINNKNDPQVIKCLGHKINIEKISTILCYEFDKDWINEQILKNKKWCYKNVGICQWFIISKPKQEIFLKMFMNCIENIEKLIKLNIDDKNYHYNVINSSGPLAFTRIVMDNLNDKIKILPSDFFCCGSWSSVPVTKNSFVSHKFTSSWITPLNK